MLKVAGCDLGPGTAPLAVTVCTTVIDPSALVITCLSLTLTMTLGSAVAWAVHDPSSGPNCNEPLAERWTVVGNPVGSAPSAWPVRVKVAVHPVTAAKRAQSAWAYAEVLSVALTQRLHSKEIAKESRGKRRIRSITVASPNLFTQIKIGLAVRSDFKTSLWLASNRPPHWAGSS